ncbi:MAG: Type and secretion system protein [Verrucomicrobiales bacterium]|nr:Type and secretion system protein [Verrucomicrobiales bacterium]
MANIVTGVDLSHDVTGSANVTYQTESQPFGPTLDLFPVVSADRSAINMTIEVSIAEFLGYADPGQIFPQIMSAGATVPLHVELPLPLSRLCQATTAANVWDNQTIMLGGLSDENISTIKGTFPAPKSSPKNCPAVNRRQPSKKT